MAFGMQKKVYEARPRKPFSKRRKPSFAALPKYKRGFEMQPSKNKGSYNLGIILFLTIAIIVSLSIPKWLTHSRKHYQEVITLKETKDNQAYSFLVRSGENRLKTQNYVGALSEFKLAHNIRPNSEEVNQLLLEVISILCEKDKSYCKEYESLQL